MRRTQAPRVLIGSALLGLIAADPAIAQVASAASAAASPSCDRNSEINQKIDSAFRKATASLANYVNPYSKTSAPQTEPLDGGYKQPDLYDLEDAVMSYLILARKCKHWDRVENVAGLVNDLLDHPNAIATRSNGKSFDVWANIVIERKDKTCRAMDTKHGDQPPGAGTTTAYCLQENQLSATRLLYLTSYLFSTLSNVRLSQIDPAGPTDPKYKYPNIRDFLTKDSSHHAHQLKDLFVRLVFEPVPAPRDPKKPEIILEPMFYGGDTSPENFTKVVARNHWDYIQTMNSDPDSVCPKGSPLICRTFFDTDLLIWSATLETIRDAPLPCAGTWPKGEAA